MRDYEVYWLILVTIQIIAIGLTRGSWIEALMYGAASTFGWLVGLDHGKKARN